MSDGPLEPAPDPPGRAGLLDELAAVALDTARQAAALVVARRRGSLTVETKSSGTDLVTSADRASEALIVDALRRARPHDGVLGEEGAGVEGTSGIRWVVDPIDGTTNFVYDHPGYSVSIAAVDTTGVHDDAASSPRSLVGVVIDPSSGDEFTATTGRGAYRNGRPIRVNAAPVLAEALVATGFGYDAARRTAQAEALVGIIGSIRDIRRMGGAALDLCSVACGRVDAYFERGLAPWDFAAGQLLVTEAGGRIGDARGGPPRAGDLIVAAPPMLFDELVDLLVAAGAEGESHAETPAMGENG